MIHEKSTSSCSREALQGEEKSPVRTGKRTEGSIFERCKDVEMAKEIVRQKIQEGVRICEKTGCWIWEKGKTSCGYGATYCEGIFFSTHVSSYELYIGPVERGFELDHLCRNRSCCNPNHLEKVLHRENLIRSPISRTFQNIQATHCPQGHEYNSENTIVRRNARECLQCKRDRDRRFYQKRKDNPDFLARRREYEKARHHQANNQLI